MTIAVAICSTEGVVIASDSMGSSGEIATSVVKVRSLPNTSVSWATAGTEFLTQSIEAVVGGLTSSAAASPRAVSDAVAEELRRAYEVPILHASTSEADTHKIECLFVGYTADRPSIIHLPADLASVECRDKTFVAIGSGHHFAHVCKALLDNYFTDQLSLEQAMMLAYRIVATVCSVSSWGVGLPVQLAWVTSEGSSQATVDDLEKLDLAVQWWLAVESSTFNAATSVDTKIPSFGSHRRGTEAEAG